MNALYLCYQSIADPLTATQVTAYLEGLALAGHRMFLLTFEAPPLSAAEQARFKRELGALGIEWSWLRYHKHPTFPATLWDTLIGIVHGLRLSRQVRIDLWHARGYVPGVMALALQRLRGGKFLFDIRGLMAEEYIDAGVWRENGWLYRLTKRVERWLLSAADAVVILTEKGRSWLRERHGQRIQGKPLRVIPCCVDLRGAATFAPSAAGSPDIPRIAYVGKLGGWYLAQEMMSFFGAARRVMPALQWEIWTQSDSTAMRSWLTDADLAGNTSVGQMRQAQLLPHLRNQCHAALCFIRPCRSKLASSPTKIGEYLAAGLPVVLNAGIGDLDALFLKERVGVLLPSLDASEYEKAAHQLAELLAEPGLRERCAQVARKNFDLEQIGWPAYGDLYRSLEPAAA